MAAFAKSWRGEPRPVRLTTFYVRCHCPWRLFAKAAGVFLLELARQGRSGAATASPATVAILTAKLRRLIERWPSLPVDVKKQLAAAKDSRATGTDYLKEKRP